MNTEHIGPGQAQAWPGPDPSLARIKLGAWPGPDRSKSRAQKTLPDSTALLDSTVFIPHDCFIEKHCSVPHGFIRPQGHIRPTRFDIQCSGRLLPIRLASFYKT